MKNGASMSMDEQVYQYEGEVYVRPLNRGMCRVIDGEIMPGPQIEDLICGALGGDGTYHLRITVEKILDEEFEV